MGYSYGATVASCPNHVELLLVISHRTGLLFVGVHAGPGCTAEAAWARELPRRLDWLYCVYFGSEKKLGHASFIELFSNSIWLSNRSTPPTPHPLTATPLNSRNTRTKPTRVVFLAEQDSIGGGSNDQTSGRWSALLLIKLMNTLCCFP